MAEANLKKQQMEYIGIGLLVLVAFFIGVARFKKKDKDDEVFSRKEFNKKLTEVEIMEKKVPKEEVKVAYTVLSDRDPFRSPLEKEGNEETVDIDVTLPSMTFQGMVWSSRRPQAIIDDKVYEIGDVIIIGSGETADEVKIKDIDKKGIHLKYKGVEFLKSP
ncbi:MAG: hypothetical protein HQ532_00055 [Candidatus Omnitrophica bacterium]|nr:hypothetical protein [Candidatus Omnitrophota bacterium]